MRLWATMLGGPLVWTAHFFALYALGSVFGTTAPARIGTLSATVIAIMADLWLLKRAAGQREGGLERWAGGLAMGSASLSLIAVFWQGCVALFA